MSTRARRLNGDSFFPIREREKNGLRTEDEPLVNADVEKICEKTCDARKVTTRLASEFQPQQEHAAGSIDSVAPATPSRAFLCFPPVPMRRLLPIPADTYDAPHPSKESRRRSPR